MIEVPSEQRILKAILDRRERKQSYQEIADWLNAQGIPAPNKGKEQKGVIIEGKWHKGTVHRICGRQA